MAITKRMGEIYQDYISGLSVPTIAARYEISTGTVLKKIKTIEQALDPIKSIPQQLTSEPVIITKWKLEKIKEGIERFINENNRPPTSRDFDESQYLPSARQIQRVYGGLVAIREKLGYIDLDFTKGDLRGVIAKNANKRGISAENYFEPILIEKFGEPYVHVQKRYYKNSKNRYDFFVYAHNKNFAVDTFTTDRAKYIESNLRHKINRYKNAPSDLIIYFVLVGEEYTKDDILKARNSIKELIRYPNLKPVHESEFIVLLDEYKPLLSPLGLRKLEL